MAVITTTDAGGPLDVVSNRETGLVVRPDAAEIGVKSGIVGEDTNLDRLVRRKGAACGKRQRAAEEKS